MAKNWVKANAGWLPISLLPAKAPALLFANEELTKYWMVEKPKGAPDSDDGDKAAFWSPVEFV